MNMSTILAAVVLTSGMAATTIVETTQSFCNLARDTVNDTLNHTTHGLIIEDQEVRDDSVVLWVVLLPGSSPICMANISVFHDDIQLNYTYQIIHGTDTLLQGLTGRISLPPYPEYDLIVDGGYSIHILADG